MCCSVSWKKIVSFVFAFIFGLFAANFFQKDISLSNSQPNKIQNAKPLNKIIHQEEGIGICPGSALKTNTDNPIEKTRQVTRDLKITSKPRANYTDIARQNYIQGTVILRVTFLANGQIGNVLSVSDLPDGLTEQAMTAATKIKFEPMLVNGKPIAVTKQVQYSFTVY